MGRSCSICRLSVAGAIDEAVRGGRPVRSIAAEFAVAYDSLVRHARNHIPNRVGLRNPEAPTDEVSPTGPDPLDELVTALRVRALAGNPSDTREYRLALAAQADVRHAAPPTRDLAAEPEWLAVRTTLLRALDPFPEARIAVADALGGID